ncbi:MAG: AAA family ATPase [Terriglobales bacterium]|jgi:hypothetical protein
MENLYVQPETAAPNLAGDALVSEASESSSSVALARDDVRERAPEVLALSRWQPTSIEWLWEPYVAKCMITTLSGAPGAGKTYLALALAAGVTRGCPPNAPDAAAGGGARPAAEPGGNVLYVTADENPGLILGPRFAAMGGDTARFHLLRDVLEGEERGPVELAEIALLDAAVRMSSASLLIVDTLESGMREGKAARVLEQLARLAEARQCAILLLCNQNDEDAKRQPPWVVSSSVRSRLRAELARDYPAGRVLRHLKSSFGRLGDPLGFEIDRDGILRFTPAKVKEYVLPCFQHRGETAAERAELFLRNHLQHHGALAAVLYDQAQHEGLSRRTLERAKERLGVVAENVVDDWGRILYWEWRLPEPCPVSSTADGTPTGTQGDAKG